MRHALPLVLSLVWWLSLPAPPVAAAELAQGDFVVEINEHGLLTGLPSGPVHTVDGPRVTLTGDPAEWYGISFERASGSVVGSASGSQVDWNPARAPVTFLSIDAEPHRAVTTSMLEGLQIRSDLRFEGEILVVTVTLTNLGAETASNILFSREWQAEPDGDAPPTFPYDIPGTGAAPAGICRRLWMPDTLSPGASRSLTFSYRRLVPSAPLLVGVDVPLSQWTGGSFPAGLNLGLTNGVSFGDYDGDGWIDIFACESAHLWRNLAGSNWQLAADLDIVLPPTSIRYGSSFGDYNNDGLPDIGTEPRNTFTGDNCMHILKNLGGGPNFTDIATDPVLVDVQPCLADSETICWGDVDGDANLDCFLPVYPPWVSSVGNFFLHNLGPTGPGGQYRFREMSAIAGLDNPPPASARPEGAQFVDADYDGDLDLYSNGHLYQNLSAPGEPLFQAMSPGASGIAMSTVLDEGAMLFDYDLDGDYDLVIVYTGPGVRIWESFGDGMFTLNIQNLVESPFIGLDLGMSAEDWDNDGDIDFTTRQVFRRNMLMETGTPSFIVASHTIPGFHLTSATPAWGDWDRDGDLDCALGNWLSFGNFYENILYDGSEPLAQRRFIRVRPLRDSVEVPAGLETEYGTSVEIRIRGDESGLRRKKFTASSAGYLNQNEYTLHFGLPDDPAPGDDTEDLRFDVLADFPSPPTEGFWRVDRHVNPALGGVHLAALSDREIVIFRSGRVILDGQVHEPTGYEPALLVTGAGGLRLPTASQALPLPAPLLSFNLAGIELSTAGASERVRIREVLIDGELDEAVLCGGKLLNVGLWDVTDPGEPVLVPGGAIRALATVENRRTIVPVNILLDVDRVYRMAARLKSIRGTPINGAWVHDSLSITGGITFVDASPCTPDGILDAVLDPSQIYMTVRFAPVSFVSGEFMRGDCNVDGAFDLGDPIHYLLALFGSSGQVLSCEDACDANNDGIIDIADGVSMLMTLFSGGAPLPPPTGACGPDDNLDDLTCEEFHLCL